MRLLACYDNTPLPGNYWADWLPKDMMRPGMAVFEPFREMLSAEVFAALFCAYWVCVMNLRRAEAAPLRWVACSVLICLLRAGVIVICMIS